MASKPWPDQEWSLHDITLENAPTRAVTGRHWDDDTTTSGRARAVPAVHFHSDDLEDAGWEADFELTVPADLPSGIYAAWLQAGDHADYLPFAVRPATGAPGAAIAVLIPTLTYEV